MQLPVEMMLTIAIATGLTGLMFLYMPDRIRPFEAWLNAPVGNREMAALRIGLHGERMAEQLMNRVILSRQITWDDWLVKHPRCAGLGLCAAAIYLITLV